jgi:hypothetical protein
MPIVVLLVAYLLHGFEDAAKTSAEQGQGHSPASAAGASTEP